MKEFRFTLITDQQKNPDKAKKVADLIRDLLNFDKEASISKYYKLDNSFKIEFRGEIESDIIAKSVELTDRICSPWLFYYHRDENEVELIFNRDNHTRFRDQRFNVVCWANFVVF